MALKVLTDEQRIVQQVIEIFGTQETLARHLRIDQSAVSLWKLKGIIPARRQRQIIEISKLLCRSKKIKRSVKPDDFHVLKNAQDAPQESADE